MSEPERINLDESHLLLSEIEALLSDPRLVASGGEVVQNVTPHPTAGPLDSFEHSPVAHAELAEAWLDPDDMPFTPQPRPGKPAAGRVFSFIVTLAMVAWASWLILPEFDFRILHRHDVTYKDGILTAHPVQLASIYPAIVNELYVNPQSLGNELIPANRPIARLTHSGPALAEGPSVVELAVPYDARLVSVDTPAGGITQPGMPVVTLYDPRQMAVIATVEAKELDRLRRGMVVKLTNEQVPGSIAGVLDAAVPLLGTDHEPTTRRYVNIRIIPDREAIRDLVPGLRFQVRIDTKSVDEDASALVVSGPS